MKPLEIAATAIAAGFQCLVVLDLADVGTSTGGGTDELLHEIRNAAPGINLVAGGGVRGIADIHRLEQLGINAVLVASALHDGRLSREEIAGLEPRALHS